MECKLLSSIFYDLGKNLAESCPFPPDAKNKATNEYFLKAVEEFLLSLPLLHQFVYSTKMRIINGTNNLTCHAFVKMNARNGFIKILKSKASLNV